ncbi:MAG: ribosome maturation factor RimM [Thermodesulfobacteriota bacterium]
MRYDYCLVGKVIKPHGVRGKVKVEYFGEDLDGFTRYTKIYIQIEPNRWKSFEILKVYPQPPRLILQLKGIERIEETGPLIGREIYVKREEMPQLGKGEYYWFEIIGLEVETKGRKKLGKIKEIFPTGANDVYVIEGKRREIFLPAIEEVIEKIDLEQGVMEVGWIEGLWEKEDEI